MKHYSGRFNLDVIGLRHARKRRCIAWGACPTASMDARFSNGDVQVDGAWAAVGGGASAGAGTSATGGKGGGGDGLGGMGGGIIKPMYRSPIAENVELSDDWKSQPLTLSPARSEKYMYRSMNGSASRYAKTVLMKLRTAGGSADYMKVLDRKTEVPFKGQDDQEHT